MGAYGSFSVWPQDVIRHAWLASDFIFFPCLFLPFLFHPSHKGYQKSFQIYLTQLPLSVRKNLTEDPQG